MSLDKLTKIDEYLSTSVDDMIITPLITDVINKEFVEKFNELNIKFGSNKVNYFFKGVRENKIYKKFTYIDICPKCNELFKKDISLSALKSGVDFKCLVCIDSENKANELIKKLSYAKYNEDRLINRIETTKNYIAKFLNPLNSFNKEIHFNERWNSINFNDYSHIEDNIVKYIKNMDYKSFLKTPYWQAVSYKRKAQCDFKCQLCNSNKNLETHHPTYDIKGVEIFNMKKLTVLCHVCHDKHHK